MVGLFLLEDISIPLHAMLYIFYSSSASSMLLTKGIGVMMVTLFLLTEGNIFPTCWGKVHFTLEFFAED